MKRKIKAILVVVLIAILMVPFSSGELYAKDYFVQNDFRGNMDCFEIKRKLDGKLGIDECRVDNEVIALKNTRTIAQSDGLEEVSTIYNGTITGYLSETDDYVLYPANLELGEYLQARLEIPNSWEVDYDLLLFDSNLSLIKSSDYVTYINTDGTLEESIGYIATGTETVYVCVYSVLGGSATDQFTLDYTITTNFSGQGEPSENAKEAQALNLGVAGITVTASLNSSIDNDWYSFEVLDNPAYHKIRLSITGNSSTNGCNMEIYRDLVTNPEYYGMEFIGAGNGGEITLPAGSYYLRVVSTNTASNFDASNLCTYNLSIVPVSRVDEIRITEIVSNHGNIVTDYPQGTKYRVDGEQTNYVVVKGIAYYLDEQGLRHEAANANIRGIIEDLQWSQLNRPDMAFVNSWAVTNSSGSYRLEFYLHSGVGGLRYSAPVSVHCYDIMEVTVNPTDNEYICSENDFYYLVRCIR